MPIGIPIIEELSTSKSASLTARVERFIPVLILKVVCAELYLADRIEINNTKRIIFFHENRFKYNNMASY